MGSGSDGKLDCRIEGRLFQICQRPPYPTEGQTHLIAVKEKGRRAKMLTTLALAKYAIRPDTSVHNQLVQATT
jgi:hypothetical protein